MKHKIAAILTVCSNDYKFFDDCVNSIKPFCSKIVIPLSDKFWNGEEENQEILDKIREKASNDNQLQIVEYKITDGKEPWYWEEYGRKQGIYSLMYSDIDYILFIDVDEVIETNKFIGWLDKDYYKKYDTVQLKCYWYWRDKKYQSTSFEDGPICMMNLESAWNWYNSKMLVRGRALIGNILIGASAEDSLPLVHHYSWVRTKEEMLLKVRSWGHVGDRNWEFLVETEFEREFNPETDKDFVHGYVYEEIK